MTIYIFYRQVSRHKSTAIYVMHRNELTSWWKVSIADQPGYYNLQLDLPTRPFKLPRRLLDFIWMQIALSSILSLITDRGIGYAMGGISLSGFALLWWEQRTKTSARLSHGLAIKRVGFEAWICLSRNSTAFKWRKCLGRRSSHRSNTSRKMTGMEILSGWGASMKVDSCAWSGDIG